MTTGSGSLTNAVLGGRYRIGECIGRGGMGAVFEAEHTWTGRRVAVKVLDAESDAEARETLNAEAMERFLSEARAASKVHHPNVVDVLDMGRDSERGVVFLVQERLSGEDLRHRLEARGSLSLEETAAVLLPVMDALEAAHAQGVIHRDIKPANIFLATAHDGAVVPKVIDFGVARLREGVDASVTRSGVALGTAGYMAPEQCRGARDVDARADVWAVGVVWFECLAGRRPFEGKGYLEVIAQTLTEKAPSLRAVAPDVPESVADAVDRALARSADGRHATMAEFRARLMETVGVTAVMPSSNVAPTTDAPKDADARALADTGSAIVSDAPARSHTQLASPRATGRWIAVGAFAVLLVALVWNSPPSPTERPPLQANVIVSPPATRPEHDLADASAAVVIEDAGRTPGDATVTATATPGAGARTPRVERRVRVTADAGRGPSANGAVINGAPVLEP